MKTPQKTIRLLIIINKISNNVYFIFLFSDYDRLLPKRFKVIIISIILHSQTYEVILNMGVDIRMKFNMLSECLTS